MMRYLWKLLRRIRYGKMRYLWKLLRRIRYGKMRYLLKLLRRIRYDVVHFLCQPGALRMRRCEERMWKLCVAVRIAVLQSFYFES
jgi:hypothetical protein